MDAARRWKTAGGVAAWGTAVLLAGQVALATPAAVATYFPLAEGILWVYRTNAGEVVIRVGRTMPVGGHVCRAIETVVGGTARQVECYRVGPDGVYAHQRSYAAGTVVLDPPQRVLAAPVRAGNRWEWTGRMGDQGVVIHYTWARRETVAVPAGTYEAMQLYFTGVLGQDTRVQSWRWYAPGVGMIKEDSLISRGPQSLRTYAELVRMTRPQ
ncbi:MAG: hypothetical protein QN168_10860 [Armatimonadota bacterium]|nr:hypothetical protein [Armatimonadota bacterium]